MNATIQMLDTMHTQNGTSATRSLQEHVQADDMAPHQSTFHGGVGRRRRRRDGVEAPPRAPQRCAEYARNIPSPPPCRRRKNLHRTTSEHDENKPAVRTTGATRYPPHSSWVLRRAGALYVGVRSARVAYLRCIRKEIHERKELGNDRSALLTTPLCLVQE